MKEKEGEKDEVGKREGRGREEKEREKRRGEKGW